MASPIQHAPDNTLSCPDPGRSHPAPLQDYSGEEGGDLFHIGVAELPLAGDAEHLGLEVRVVLGGGPDQEDRSEEHTSELQSRPHLVCRLLLEKKNKKKQHNTYTNNNTT